MEKKELLAEFEMLRVKIYEAANNLNYGDYVAAAFNLGNLYEILRSNIENMLKEEDNERI